jgi:hypothetical protein
MTIYSMISALRELGSIRNATRSDRYSAHDIFFNDNLFEG